MEIDEIERLRNEGIIPEEIFDSEYRCIPIRSSGTYYPYKLIMGASNYVVTEDPAFEEYLIPKLNDDKSLVVIGCDVARVDDWSSIVVISLNQLMEREWDYRTQIGNASFNHVIYAYQARNQTYAAFASKIREVKDRFPNCLGIAIDARGGEAVLDQLAFDSPKGRRPWFDKEDEDRAPKVVNGEAIITSIKATDALNNEWNSFTKAQFEHGRLRFPKTVMRHANSEMEEVHRNISKLMHQFISIRTKISEKSHLLSFTTADPKKFKKDLFSGALYAMAIAKGHLFKEVAIRKPKPLVAFV